MISVIAQLTNEAAFLIKLEKYRAALSFLEEAQRDIWTSKRESQKSLDNLVSYDIDEIDIAQPLEIVDNSASRDNEVKIREGERDEGMRTFSGPLQMIIPFLMGDTDCHPIDETIVDAVVNYNFGIVMTRLDQDDIAYPYFQKSLSLKQNCSPFTQNKAKFGFLEIAILHNLGHINYRNRKFKEAFHEYWTAYEKMSKECYQSSSALIDKALSLNCIGMVIMEMAQGSGDGAEDSMHHLSEALTTIQSFGEKDYQVYDRFLREKITATIMSNIARVQVLRGEVDEALKLYKKAFKIRRRILGEDHLDTITMHFDMAEAFHLNGQSKKALEFLQRRVSVSPTLLDHDLVEVFNLFAKVYIDLNNLPKASRFYKKSLRQLKVTYPLDDNQIAKTLNSLGELFCKMGDHESALKVRQKQNANYLAIQLINNIFVMAWSTPTIIGL